jgi:hypothetical protein
LGAAFGRLEPLIGVFDLRFELRDEVAVRMDGFDRIVGLVGWVSFGIATGTADNYKWSVGYVARVRGYEEENGDNEMIWGTMR